MYKRQVLVLVVFVFEFGEELGEELVCEPFATGGGVAAELANIVVSFVAVRFSFFMSGLRKVELETVEADEFVFCESKLSEVSILTLAAGKLSVGDTLAASGLSMVSGTAT